MSFLGFDLIEREAANVHAPRAELPFLTVTALARPGLRRKPHHQCRWLGLGDSVPKRHLGIGKRTRVLRGDHGFLRVSRRLARLLAYYRRRVLAYSDVQTKNGAHMGLGKMAARAQGAAPCAA